MVGAIPVKSMITGTIPLGSDQLSRVDHLHLGTQLLAVLLPLGTQPLVLVVLVALALLEVHPPKGVTGQVHLVAAVTSEVVQDQVVAVLRAALLVPVDLGVVDLLHIKAVLVHQVVVSEVARRTR
jgi:hypothetical protein